MDSNENYNQEHGDATGGQYGQHHSPGNQGAPPPGGGVNVGAQPQQPYSYSRKSPVLACLLSCMPGLGQIYVGYYMRGYVHAGIFVLLITLLSTGAGAMEPLFGTTLGFFILYNIIDAGRRAVLYNQAMAGASQMELPEDVKLPTGGSVGGGIVLIVVGVLLVMYTKFDFDMDWVGEWWPLGLVGLGIHLVMKARRNNREAG